MERVRLWRAGLVLAVVVGMAFGALPARLARAAPISDCTSSNVGAIIAALEAGGDVSFNCGVATIVVTETIDITSTSTPTTVDGGGQITFDGGGVWRVFQVGEGASLSLDGVTVRGGLSGTTSPGGALYNAGTLEISDSTFSDNFARLAGAIGNDGVATITSTTFRDNSAYSFHGGAILNRGTLDVADGTFSSNDAIDQGGAIDNRGTLNLTGVTIDDNSARKGGGVYVDSAAVTNITATTLSRNRASAWGGGLYAQNGTLNVTNATLSGNSADSQGGALYVINASVSVTSSTLAANDAPSGRALFNSAGVTFANTIVSSASPGSNCDNSGTINSSGYNLGSDLTCPFNTPTDRKNTDPLLASLADNTGPAQTHALQPGSPAIDAGNCPGQATDQRGVSRPQDGNGDGTAACDIGAFELAATGTNSPPDVTDQALVTSEDSSLAITLGATDPENDAINFAVTDGPSFGTLSGDAPHLIYTPNANFHGSDGFSFSACAPAPQCDSAGVTIEVQPVNDPPATSSSPVVTDEDGAVAVTLTGTDPDGHALTFSVIGQPSHGTLSGTPPTLMYSPNANFNGQDSFLYQVCDALQACVSGQADISVSALNDAPVIADADYSTPLNTPLSVSLPTSDIDGDLLLYSIADGPDHGDAELVGFELRYTPTVGYSGPDSVTIQACDPANACDSATFTLTVTAVNGVPDADDIAYTTDEDMPVEISLSASDPNQDALTYSVLEGPSHGSLTGTTPNLTYTPSFNYFGTDSITFQACDPVPLCDTAVVTIFINSVNDAPVISDVSISTDEDVSVSMLLDASDPDGDALTYRIDSNPSHGVVTGLAQSPIYTPNSDFNGVDSFVIEVCDTQPQPLCVTATISITVSSQNDTPSAGEDAFTIDEDSGITALDVLANDDDIEDVQHPTIVAVTQGAYGAVAITGDGAGLTYEPSPHFHGQDSFTYTVSDANGVTATAIVKMTVSAVNDPPTTSDASVQTAEDTPLARQLNATDVDGDALTFSITSDPSHGHASISGSLLSYQPGANVHGADALTVQVCDPSLFCAASLISITISPVNDLPVASGGAFATAEDAPLSFVIGATDVDGDTLTYSVVSGPANGSLSGIAPDLTYTPNMNFHGADSFVFQACDPLAGCQSASVTFDISAVNDAPVAGEDVFSVLEDSQVTTLTVLGNDSDVEDGQALRITAVTQGTRGGAVVITGDGSGLTFQPAPNANGNETFTYTIQDSSGSPATALVTVMIEPVNDAPTATDAGVSTPEDTALPIALSASDADGDSLDYEIISGPTHGTLTGTLPNPTYAPHTNFHGSDSFTFQACDASASCATETVSVNVTPVNDVPVADAGDDGTATEGQIVTLDAGGSSDVDGDTLSFVWEIIDTGAVGVALSDTRVANPTFTPPDNGTFTFQVTVSDGHGGSHTDQVSVVVGNAPPAVGLAAPASGAMNDQLLLEAGWSDPGVDDVITCLIDWGDGQIAEFSGGSGGFGSCAASHWYATVGAFTIRVTATDDDGEHASWTSTYQVGFDFTWRAPYAAFPDWSTVRAGDPIYLRFSLGGDRGTDVLSEGYPKMQPVRCGSSDAVAGTQPIQALRGLRYYAGGDYYQFVWRTQSSWAGGCYQLILRLTDGSEHRLNFRFTRTG